MPTLGASRFSKYTFLVLFLFMSGTALHITWPPKDPPRDLGVGPQMASPLQSQPQNQPPRLNVLFPPVLLLHLLGSLILFAGYARHHRQKIHKGVLKQDADFKRQLRVFTTHTRNALDVLLYPLVDHQSINDLNPKTVPHLLREAKRYLWVIQSMVMLPFEVQETDIKQLITTTLSIWHLHHPRGKIIFRPRRGIPQTIKTNPFLLQVVLLSLIALSAGAYPDDAHTVIIDLEREGDKLHLRVRDKGIPLTPHMRFTIHKKLYPDGYFPVYGDLSVNDETLRALIQKLGGMTTFSGHPLQQENVTSVTLPLTCLQTANNPGNVVAFVGPKQSGL